MIQPRYEHDCKDCEYLGLHRDHDLYYCPKSDGGTVLARYGNEGSEYSSFMLSVVLYAHLDSDHVLVEAARRKIVDWQEIERRYNRIEL